MRIARSLPLLWLLVAPVAVAGVSERAYDRAIELVDRLYLYPDDLEASALLHDAARELADEIDWLLVETQGDAVYLRHGSGEPIGSVSVASMDTLPDALRSLEQLVVEAPWELGEVDPRLEALEGATHALDRYSRILAGDRLARFDVRLKGTLVGIGATLTLAPGEPGADEALRVRDLIEGGPAEQGGLRPGDVIERVDGVSTTNMPLREATRRIRGEEGTEVVLTVNRDGEQLELSFTRAEVVIANVRHRVLEGGVGYVEITHFSQRTVENLRAALVALREAGALDEGLVIDLRGNTGGSMKEAARSADQFLGEGMLLRTAGPDGGQVQNLQARMDAVDAGDEPPVPLVVLMDRRTASGSEILAGALLQLGRAVLIGSRSYGKGTVQKIYNLDDETRLKLTVAQYLLSGDREIAAGGLIPDAALAEIELDSTGVRYQGWSRSRSGHDRTEIVPVVLEREGWRGQPFTERDIALELGRRTVLAAESAERAAVLEGLQQVAPQILAEEEARLVEALEAQGLDWSRAPEESPDRVPQADVDLTARFDGGHEDRITVGAEVTNRGEEPLYRAQVELVSDSFHPWTGLTIPLGRIDPGATARGEVALRLGPGVHLREDSVGVEVRADRRPTQYVGEEMLKARSSEVPRVAVGLRMAGEETERTAKVAVRNLSPVPIEGLEVYFAAPGDMDVELIDRARRIDLDPHARAELDLAVAVGPDAPEVLPMRLVIESDRYDHLATWPVDVPLDGTRVELEAPRIVVEDYPLSAPVGPWTLRAQAHDDRRIDHVVLYADGHKVAWAGGGSPRAELVAPVDLHYGSNRLTVVAEDDQGLTGRYYFVVRGETEASVDAIEVGPDDDTP